MIGAIDIGGTKIAVAMVDSQGRILGRQECPTEPERGFDDAFARICSMVRAAARAACAEIDGIGVGCTGPVYPLTGTIGVVDFLPGWNGAPIVERLAHEFSVKVAMENDADAAALGEARWGAGKGASRFIYVTISTGIGGGMVFDGKLYRGVGGAHPEIGHHVIDPAGPRCFCGACGCWEVLAAGPAMAQWAKSEDRAGEAEGWTAQSICEHAASSELARRAVEREARYLGIGLANLVTTFCPDVIALGGGVMNSSHLFLDRAREIVRASCGLVPHEQTAITIAALRHNVALAGAACVWHNSFSER